MNYDTSIHMNPDANAWAKFFMQTRAENPDLVIDEALMVGWFANAMMAMHDHLHGGGPINGDHAEHILASGAAQKEPVATLMIGVEDSERGTAKFNLLNYNLPVGEYKLYLASGAAHTSKTIDVKWHHDLAKKETDRG